MPERTWDVAFAATGTYSVVEREDGRDQRCIGYGLTKDEAHQVANCREATTALGDLWEAIHREDSEDFDSDRVRRELGRAFDVLLRVKGVKA